MNFDLTWLLVGLYLSLDLLVFCLFICVLICLLIIGCLYWLLRNFGLAASGLRCWALVIWFDIHAVAVCFA